ncbi:histidine kinase dimerization/phospho-acceptor domain-containing protein [Pontiellaceae bacterium B1224]|nr:histidine kinase dimerization/phospho-acceptor domain-containing protein [Pontiellaceae bacterium B1224]
MFKNDANTTIPELTAILLARLGFLWLIVLVSLLFPTGDPSFYAFMGVAFVITIPYSLWLRNRLRATQFAPLQFVVDLILVNGLVYFTGGVHSVLTLLYPLVILSAGVVGTPKQASQITALAIITYILMATLLSNKWIVEYMPVDAVVTDETSAGSIFIRSLTFALFGAASIYISKRCGYTETYRRDLTDTAEAILQNIPTPSVLLDWEGYVFYANEAALNLTGTDAVTFTGTLFSDWICDDAEEINESFGNAFYLKRPNNSPIPVVRTSRDFQLLEYALLGSNGRKYEAMNVSLVMLSDISQALETDRQLKKVERITAATRIAGEMAHEIRTPLTAISASVQLLRHYEDRTTSADWLPNSPRRNDRKELFNHIENASKQMDTVVKNFVDFAEFSPAALLSIIKLDSNPVNKGYIDHLNTVGRGYHDGQNTDCG